MLKTSDDASCEELRGEIKRLVSLNNPLITPSFTNALESLFSAVEYDDNELVRSAVNGVLEEFQKSIDQEAKKRLERAAAISEFCEDVFRRIKFLAVEDADELGKSLESLFDTAIEGLAGILNGPAKLLQSHDFDIESEPLLLKGIDELRTQKQKVLANWPWSDLELPPVNWDMVAESRAAFARGEAKRLSDIIADLGGGQDGGGDKKP